METFKTQPVPLPATVADPTLANSGIAMPDEREESLTFSDELFVIQGEQEQEQEQEYARIRTRYAALVVGAEEGVEIGF